MIEAAVRVLPGLDLVAVGDAAVLHNLYWRVVDSADVDASVAAARWWRPLRCWLDAWCAGRPAPLPPLAEPRGDWDAAVRRALLAIPRGEVRSYGQLAAFLGRPGAARAVAGACGRNPFTLIVPCHRVVAVGGLGGYSSVGGTDTKRRLLIAEGVDLTGLGDQAGGGTSRVPGDLKKAL